MKKLIPFTLERWQQGNCTPKTADGRDVKQLTFLEVNDTFPLIGAVESKKESWSLNGWYNSVDAGDKRNLMLEVDCEVVYVSILKGYVGNPYPVLNQLPELWQGHPHFIKEIKVEL